MRLNKLSKPQILKFKKFFSKQGSLTALDESFKKNFQFKRFFFVTSKKNSIRGNHAHVFCSQILFCFYGKIEVSTIDSNLKKNIFTLEANKNKALYLPTFTWNKIKFIKDKSLLFVICNYKYDKKRDYINSFKKFIKIVNDKKLGIF
jgi:dTDP-4-dehydrorhamnose 3,5-epimerase-like enzyme